MQEAPQPPPPPPPPPSPSLILFARGVIARLAIWPALRVAVEQNWGGPEGIAKRRWLASVLVDAFEAPTKPDVEDVEETLLQVMEDEFEAVLEDGSALDVARDVVKLWDEVREGKDENVKMFEEVEGKVKGSKVPVQMEGGESDDEEGGWEEEEEDEEEEAPRLVRRQTDPVVDEDGFTLVRSKGKSR